MLCKCTFVPYSVPSKPELPCGFFTAQSVLESVPGIKEKMAPPHHIRTSQHFRARKKVQTNKVLDRLTYCPQKHKQKKRKKLRQSLQNKSFREPQIVVPLTKVKFGSLNVNGLGLDTCWSVQQLLQTRGFDVRL